MISEQVRTLQELLPVRARWDPVEKILYLNVIPLLLRIIAYAYDWNHSCRYSLFYSDDRFPVSDDSHYNFTNILEAKPFGLH